MLHSVDPHYQLTMSTYASSAGDPSGFYDIPGLSKWVNAFFVMAYGVNQGATGSQDENDDAAYVDQYVSEVGASKVILGLPLFGYDEPTKGPALGERPTGPAVPVTYAQAVASGPTYWDAATDTAWTSYQSGGQWHQVFFDNANTDCGEGATGFEVRSPRGRCLGPWHGGYRQLGARPARRQLRLPPYATGGTHHLGCGSQHRQEGQEQVAGRRRRDGSTSTTTSVHPGGTGGKPEERLDDRRPVRQPRHRVHRTTTTHNSPQLLPRRRRPAPGSSAEHRKYDDLIGDLPVMPGHRTEPGRRAPMSRRRGVAYGFVALTAVLGVAASACGNSGPSEGALAGKSATAVLSISVKAYHRQKSVSFVTKTVAGKTSTVQVGAISKKAASESVQLVDASRPPGSPRRRVGLPSCRDSVLGAAAQPVDRPGRGPCRAVDLVPEGEPGLLQHHVNH